jgi:putative DNA primase/helicase
VVVEGLTDAALLQVRGDTRTVASVAARLSNLQIQTLARHRIERVFVCGDPDGAGDRGTLTNIQALAAAGIAAYVVPRLPDGLDPDEYVQTHGIDAWREHVARSIHAFRFKARTILEKHRPTAGWTDAAQDAAVNEALAFAATQPEQRADELARHFWPEILGATGGDGNALLARLRAKQEGSNGAAPRRPWWSRSNRRVQFSGRLL